MYKLYYGNHDNKELVTTVESEQEAFHAISKYIEEHNWKSYYLRVNYFGNTKMIDYGSHTRFFYICKEVS